MYAYFNRFIYSVSRLKVHLLGTGVKEVADKTEFFMFWMEHQNLFAIISTTQSVEF